MGHTQGITVDKQQNVALQNLSVRYVPKLHQGVKYNIQITHYLNSRETMHLEFVLKLKKIPEKKITNVCLVFLFR